MQHLIREIRHNKQLADDLREFLRAISERVYDARLWEPEWTRGHADLARRAIEQASLDILREHGENRDVIRFE